MLNRGKHSLPYRLLLVALLGLATLGWSASASADVPAPGDFSPSIWSDKADYAPGEHVVLSGANWAAGESVHVTVNDDEGSTWNRAVDVTADDAGNITDEFDLPSWFVAKYHVRAEGASGAVATHDFTDGNVSFQLATDSAAAGSWSVTYSHWPNGTCTNPADATGLVWNSGSGNVSNPGGNNQSLKPTGASATGFVFLYWSATAAST